MFNYLELFAINNHLEAYLNDLQSMQKEEQKEVLRLSKGITNKLIMEGDFLEKNANNDEYYFGTHLVLFDTTELDFLLTSMYHVLSSDTVQKDRRKNIDFINTLTSLLYKLYEYYKQTNWQLEQFDEKAYIYITEGVKI